MKIINLFPGSYNSNCYILIHNGKALVIDPSASAKSILARVAQEGATLTGILLTHGHFDHIVSIDTLRRACQVPLMIHKEDAAAMTPMAANCPALVRLVSDITVACTTLTVPTAATPKPKLTAK